MRVGMGYDVHKLVEGRDLIMGGVKIDYNFASSYTARTPPTNFALVRAQVK